MKIRKLEVSGYKNLNIELDNSAELISIIGNNGSGKSNLLESISLIFKSLYSKGEKTSFDYMIEYTTTSNYKIKIDKKGETEVYYLNGDVINSIDEYLPKKIVALYSGEENRLWKMCYEHFYDIFINELNTNQLVTQTPQMLFVNKYYWHISLLSLAVSNSKDNQAFIEHGLKIKSIEKISFDFNKSRYKSFKSSAALEFIKCIDSKQEYTLAELINVFEQNHYTADDVYNFLYIAFTSKDRKIIENISIHFNDNLTVEDLSEGEKKLLLIKGALEFSGQEDSLFILDEPDAHIHLNNKELILKTFSPYKSNRQIIFTTHSPTVTQAINESELYMLDKGKVVEREKVEVINDLTGEFWNRHQQNSFLSSNKKLVLLVEGKHDKSHIKNAFHALKNNYESLDFDIYSLGGESKIHPFMVGLYETNIKNHVTYIAIYDNDKAGKDGLNKFAPNKLLNGYRKLKKDIVEHDNYFACLLVNPIGFTADCTIENMFESDKYNEAYRQALEDSAELFKNNSIDTVSKSIKNTSKNILSESSKSFNVDDFKHFRGLFDLISKIYNRNVEKITVATIVQDVIQTEVSNTLELDPNEIFIFKNAKGIFNTSSNTLTLLAGSKINKINDKAKEREKRDSILKIIQNKIHGDEIEILEDVVFPSPSGAAIFVNSGNRNGWKCWKNEKGQSLDDLYRQG
jgi:predicted ATPase